LPWAVMFLRFQRATIVMRVTEQLPFEHG
jgi:hypothetical protein